MDISKNRFYKKVYKLENLIGCESDGEKLQKITRKTFLKEVEQVKYLKKAINYISLYKVILNINKEL